MQETRYPELYVGLLAIQLKENLPALTTADACTIIRDAYRDLVVPTDPIAAEDTVRIYEYAVISARMRLGLPLD